MRKKLIIHIGMPKTGSSSIQDTLSSLSSEGDVRYAKLGMVNHGGILLSLFEEDPRRWHYHVQVGNSDKDIADFNEKYRGILKEQLEFNQAEKLVISGEDIWHMSQAALERLKSYVYEFFDEVKIVGYVRSPVSFMESAFQQLVKNHSLKEFDWTQIYPEYRCRFEKFDLVFGSENVHLRKFDFANFPKGDVVLDFCEYLGLSVDDKNIVRANDSLSAESIALLYIYRKYGLTEKITKEAFDSNKKLVELFSSLGYEKLRFTKSLVSSVLTSKSEDISWMENRLACSLDDLSSSNGVFITSESQLIEFGLAQADIVLEPLLEFLIGDKIKSPEEKVVFIIEALRNNLLGVNSTTVLPMKHRDSSFFTKEELGRIESSSSETADILRDLALALERNGDIDAAKKVIVDALKYRPNGPGIQKIYNRLFS